MLVGVDVLDDPPTIVFCFITAVEKRYTFVFRTVGDAGPYRFGVDYNYARRGAACYSRLFLRTVEDVDPYRFGVDYNYARRGAACRSRLFLRTVEDASPYSVW